MKSNLAGAMREALERQSALDKVARTRPGLARLAANLRRRTRMARRAALALLAATSVGPLAAGPAGAAETLLELIRAHPECRQFNDGCSICRIENGAASCSAPGIACIRTGWICADPAAAAPEGAPSAKAASVAIARAIGRRAFRFPAR